MGNGHMHAPPPTQRRTTFTVSSTPAIDRLVEELAVTTRELNRSNVVRLALIAMGDCKLPKDWRKRLGFDEEESAA